VATILAPQLFLAVAQTQDLAVSQANDWTNLPNVLVENTDYAVTEWSVSDLRYSYTMNLSQPDFPAYPPEESPVWIQLTLRTQVFESTVGGVRNIYVQLGNGTRREFNGLRESVGLVTRTYSGTLNEWGITRQEAEDIINGIAPVNVYAASEDPDCFWRIHWAKLEAKLQAPQTEVLTPPVTF
jgi:hypothetical protein